MWESGLSEEIISKYWFNRVIFGVTSSQFLLNGIVQAHGSKYEKINPEFARKVKNHFYVDYLNTGVYSTEEGFDFYKKMKVRFLEANFNVRKWRTNDEEDQCKLINLYEKNEGVNSGVEMNNVNSINNDKVLGLYWNHKKDIISLKINKVVKKVINIIPTKRNILSVIASVYDPVGYLQPIVFKLKILFQKLCKSKLEWDDDIGILVNKWKEIVTSLTSSETVSFNRCFYPYDINDPIDKCYLHGFSDASISAFAAVVYFGSISRCGNVAIKFVTSKSRILPLNKSYTIPRLELLGNVILSSLIRVVYNSLHEEIANGEIFCWTDLFISLSWIRAFNQEFKLFVQNRFIKISENVNASLWRYCDTKENPSDSRYSAHQTTHPKTCQIIRYVVFKEDQRTMFICRR